MPRPCWRFVKDLYEEEATEKRGLPFHLQNSVFIVKADLLFPWRDNVDVIVKCNTSGTSFLRKLSEKPYYFVNQNQVRFFRIDTLIPYSTAAPADARVISTIASFTSFLLSIFLGNGRRILNCCG